MQRLSHIPKVDKILAWPAVEALAGRYARPAVVRAVRAVLARARESILSGTRAPGPLGEEAIIADVERELVARDAASLRRVVNGTGVVIHTNLGRSPLAETVRESLADIALGYSNLEYDLAAGERGSRHSHVEGLLCELTGAEAALVVNNNAAAVLLALAALAAGREVVVSRGELVEIGGSFRIPDVMGQSGAILKEVGTTNRTHPRDYRGAVTAQTALLLKVHCSNFAVVGFTAEVRAEELVAIGSEFSVPVMADVGSGNFLDLAALAGLHEPTVREYVRAGVDLVTFSGDKLLGGPQAGIIVGRKEALEPLRKHPLLRALRIDKLTLAALEGTLRLYRDERQAVALIPTLRMLCATPGELARRGRRILGRLRRTLPPAVELALVDGFSQVGGGALPLAELPTKLIAVRVAHLQPQQIEWKLRRAPVPVVGRIFKGEFLLDLRTILDGDIESLSSALRILGEE